MKFVRSSDGTPIYAEATGSPRNLHVVLVHGFSLSGVVFDEFCADQRLLDELYIVRYDIRGHGRSGKPETAESYVSKLYADDFKAVLDAFSLVKPVLAAWSMGGTVATDVATYLPPGTISGLLFIAAIPCAGPFVAQVGTDEVLAALSGCLETGSIASNQAAYWKFVDLLFVSPETTPFALKCLYNGHAVSPEIMRHVCEREQDIEKLWEAGREGLPLCLLKGTVDAQIKLDMVEELMKPHFQEDRFEVRVLNGGGHSLHVETKEELMWNFLEFAKRVGGKDYGS